MEEFDDIRPYRDTEVPEILKQLLADKELHNTVARMRFPRLQALLGPVARTMVKTAIRNELRGVSSVMAFQLVVKKYFDRMTAVSTRSVTESGMDNLKRDGAYLFISNHRDIALDPAFVNTALYCEGMNTARIAIGDNLLSKPFASHLMRLNKSFIVNRSAQGRQLLMATKKLSAYIRMSLQEEKESIWLAQREGRAKNSLDKTEPAIIKMLSLSRNRKDEAFSDFIRGLNIVPVSISYEWDPCDELKARELAAKSAGQDYEKAAHEDLKSIGMGITGQKGAVHVHFGDLIQGEFETPEQVADAIDAQIWQNYVLHPSNFVAYEMRYGTMPQLPVGKDGEAFDHSKHGYAKAVMTRRLSVIPAQMRDIFLDIYANPIISRLKVAGQSVNRVKTLAS
ncbi:MAG: 1-acyl-sn-glycerol-3-phosphate acyltransferase [Deltaproteobacteria bacterium]|nr:1-acyl-sn-glycerol-3-phosphate acyltransferase [Deltaproteobacteria bacterium]